MKKFSHWYFCSVMTHLTEYDANAPFFKLMVFDTVLSQYNIFGWKFLGLNLPINAVFKVKALLQNFLIFDYMSVI